MRTSSLKRAVTRRAMWAAAIAATAVACVMQGLPGAASAAEAWSGPTSIDGSFLDVSGRREIRLAKAKINDVQSPGAQFFRLHENRHGRRHRDPIHTISESYSHIGPLIAPLRVFLDYLGTQAVFNCDWNKATD